MVTASGSSISVKDGWCVKFAPSDSWGWDTASSATTAYTTSIAYDKVIKTIYEMYGSYTYPVERPLSERLPIEFDLPAGQRVLTLPDGSKLAIDDQGNYKIEDKDSRVTYQANRIRDWSPHLNASDMVADFVKYVGSLGVKQKDVLGLPLELFINWLVIEAAERDKDPLPEDVQPIKQHRVIKSIVTPRCWDCGRFVKREIVTRTRMPFCDPSHAGRYMYRQQQLLARKSKKEHPRIQNERISKGALTLP